MSNLIFWSPFATAYFIAKTADDTPTVYPYPISTGPEVYTALSSIVLFKIEQVSILSLHPCIGVSLHCHFVQPTDFEPEKL